MKLRWIVLTLLILLLSSMAGKVDLHLSKLLEPQSLDYRIFTQIRLPRVLLAFFSGGILALSGLLFQTLFRNPLTTPFTLGISSGATLGAAAAIMLGLGSSYLGFSFVTLFGFLGALSTVVIIYLFSRRLTSTGDQRLILVGIALSFLYSAVLMVVYYLSDFQQSYQIMRFTMGSLLTVGYGDIVPVALSAVMIVFAALYYREALERFSVSDAFAFLHGVDVLRVQMTLFTVISIGVGALVSIVGPIGFIGLVVPHMVRRTLKRRIDETIVPVFFSGGLFLALCDALARVVPTVSEIPVGIITSLIGGTLFVYMLLKREVS
jgi:iron complex transport system permease protein